MINNNSFATENICFSQDVSKKLVVEIEKCQILKEQIKVYEEMNIELLKSIDLLNDVIIKKDEIIEEDRKLIEFYRLSLREQEKMYQEMLKKSKPSFKEELMKAGMYFGLGVLIGFSLIIL